MLVNEIFVAPNGEPGCPYGIGQFATFIRFQGCNLRCKYCDTVRAQETAREKGTLLSVHQLWDFVATPDIVLTGGEPFLFRKEDLLLWWSLKPSHLEIRSVTVETNGSMDISFCRQLAGWRFVVDYKPLPSCCEGEEPPRFVWDNVRLLGENDLLKFVIFTREDYGCALTVLKLVVDRLNHIPVPIAFSCAGSNAPELSVGQVQRDLLQGFLPGFLLKVPVGSKAFFDPLVAFRKLPWTPPPILVYKQMHKVTDMTDDLLVLLERKRF